MRRDRQHRAGMSDFCVPGTETRSGDGEGRRIVLCKVIWAGLKRERLRHWDVRDEMIYLRQDVSLFSLLLRVLESWSVALSSPTP